MRSGASARRYARALFALASEEQRIEDVRRELDALCQVLEGNAELGHAILRPLFPSAERRRVLSSLCERLHTGDTLRRFCSFLVDQRRIVELAAIRERYAELADEAAGRMRARVVSASPLSDAQRERLERALSARTGRQLELDLEVDASLLGGAVATVGGLVFDGSLRTQLEQLRANLMRGQ